MNKSMDQIREEGLEALRKKLGLAGMVRFLQQFDKGSGDYTATRKKWVDSTSLKTIRALAAKRHKRSK